MNASTDTATEDAARLLASHPDFKIIRRIAPRTVFAENDGRVLSKGVVVDTETTGTNPDKDAIVELGMVLFEYDPETGNAYRVLESFDQLEDPGFPIPPESTAVHGITDEMVAGKQIDDSSVAQFLADVSLVVAHNSKFDRVFLEKRLPIFESLPWGCSFRKSIGTVRESDQPSLITSLTNTVSFMVRTERRKIVSHYWKFFRSRSLNPVNWF